MLIFQFLYFIILFMIAIVAYLVRCEDSNEYENLKITNKSVVLYHKFCDEDQRKFLGKSEAIQNEILIIPGFYHISLSVKVEVKSEYWNNLHSTKLKQSILAKFKNELYWSCYQNSLYNVSLCDMEEDVRLSSSLSIDVYDALKSHFNSHQIRCNICFLSERKTDYIDVLPLTTHLKTVSFHLEQLLPQHLQKKDRFWRVEITRKDKLPLNNSVDKVFITNLSLSLQRPDNEFDKSRQCTFICGWGPTCLENSIKVCDGQINCVNGEDEDIRLCANLQKRTLSLYSLPISSSKNKTTVSSTFGSHENHKDIYILPMSQSYLFIVICIIVMIAILSCIVWCYCRVREAERRLLGTSKKNKAIKLPSDCETVCTTCDARSKLDSISNSYSYRCSINQPKHHSLTNDWADKAIESGDQRNFSNKGNDCYFPAISANSHAADFDKEILKQPSNKPDRFYSKKESVVQASEWLNLFINVSSEARQKSLRNQPPPNVSKFCSKSIVQNRNSIDEFSTTTPLTYVFPVMI